MTFRFTTRFLALCVGPFLTVANAGAQGTNPNPPTEAERPELVEKIRATYPAMPEHLVAIFADWSLQLADNSPCELVDWIAAQPPESGPPDMRLPNTCAPGIGDLTPQAAREMLGKQSIFGRIDGDTVTVVVRSSDEQVRLCCSIQGEFERIGDSEFWAARRRLPEAERAMLFLANVSDHSAQSLLVRGPLAPPEPALAAFPLQGQLLERDFESTALGETRKLRIYLPPGWSKERRWPVVYMTDFGAPVYGPMLERMIVDGIISPAVIISADSAQGDRRNAEYIKGRDRFDRHMEFFAGEMVRYARDEFAVSADRDEVAVAGSSSGGVFALWAGLLHPEVFGDAIAMSPGIVQIAPEDLAREPRARFQLSGGLYETGFIRSARLADSTLTAAGFDETGRYPAAGHAQDQWGWVLYEALRQVHARD